MLQILVCTCQRHRVALILHLVVILQYFPGSLLEEIHLCFAEVKLIVVLILSSKVCIWLLFSCFPVTWLLVLARLLGIGLLLLVTLILFLDSILLSDIGDEEAMVTFFWTWRSPLSPLEVLVFLAHESHLLMVWRSKYVFVLSFLCQFSWEDFTFNVFIRPYV